MVPQSYKKRFAFGMSYKRFSPDNLASVQLIRMGMGAEDKMTWIEATCPTCGAVEVTPGDIELGICKNHGDASYYRFTCPVCSDNVKKKAEDRVIELLIAEGVRPSHWSLPGELLETHNGPAITSDDVLDFLLLLDQPDWFEQIVEKAR